MGLSPGRIKQKTIKLVFATSQLKKHIALRSKSKDWLAWNYDNETVKLLPHGKITIYILFIPH
jgi:hypothetical protein